MESIKINDARRPSKLLMLTCFLLCARPSFQAVRFKPSPCPETFSYERTEDSSDRWYGDINWKINQTVNGVSFRITLDRPAQLLVSYTAESTSTDNRIFTGYLSDVELVPGTEYKGRIMVKYDKNKAVPMLESIHINSVRVCPLDPAILTIIGSDSQNSNNKPTHTATRPDPPNSEVFELTTERYPPSNTGRPSSSSGSNSRPNQGNNANQGSYSGTQNQGGSSRPTGSNSNGGGGSNFETNIGNTGGSSNNWNKPTSKPTKGTTLRPVPQTTTSGSGGVASSEFWNQENNANQGGSGSWNQGGSSRPTGSNSNSGGGGNVNTDSDNFGGGSNSWDKTTSRPTKSTTSRPVHTTSSNFGGGSGNSNAAATRPSSGSGSNSWNANPDNISSGGSHSNNAINNQESDTIFHGGDSSSSPHQGSVVPCGTVSIANPLITNGQKTHHGQWPWHVALYKTEGINLSYRCGGSLISKKIVITAAHCLVSNPGNKIINFKSLVVYLGKYYLKQYTGETGVQTKEVSGLKINPTYNSSNFQGDIAILTLSSEVEYTNYVRPVCLWEYTNSIDDIENKEGVVAGWGFTESDQTSEELRMATLPVVSTTQCVRSYPKFYAEYLSETAFCAGFRNGTGPCNGDSGGGLVFKRNDNTWYLRGIVSLSVAKEGLNFCDASYYVIFTDTARYVDFIRKNSS